MDEGGGAEGSNKERDRTNDRPVAGVRYVISGCLVAHIRLLDSIAIWVGGLRAGALNMV